MRWKKLISIVLAVGLVSSFGTVASAQSSPLNSVRVGEAQGHPGESVEASVYLTPESLINQYDITIAYDTDSLELEPGNKVTNELGVSDHGDTFATDFSVAGEVNVQADLVDYAIFTDNTKAFTLHFKIKDTAQAGDLALDVTKYELYEGEELGSTTVQAGKIHVVVDTHIVTFDSQGGSAVDSLEQVRDGEKIVEPGAPARDGYAFAGWYTDEAGTSAWNFAADPVTSDLTLFAKWTRNAANIAIGSASGTPGSTVSVPVWVSSSSYGIGAYGMQIDYDPEALEVVSLTGEEGDYFDSNYDNDAGWLKAVWADSDGGDTPIAAGEKLFTIQFKIKSEATTGDKSLTVQTGDVSRFSISDTHAIEMEKTLAPGKVTVSEAQVQYAVTFDSQGGSAVSGVTVNSGGTVSAPTTPTKAGYTFAGWYKEAAGTTAWNFATDTVTGNVTLYAKWTALLPDTYAVTFDSQGGSAVSGVTVISGGTVSEPTAPTKAGYTFAGWYKEAAGTTAWNFATDTVTGNVTLYAKWTSVAPNDPITPPSIPAANDGLQVIVNGVVKDQIAKGATATVNGKTVLTATIDRDKLIEQLKQAADEPVVVVPVTSSVDKVTVQLTGDLVKSMESKQTILEVRTPAGIYRLPAKQIAIDDVAAKLGTEVGLPDIVIHVDIAGSDEAAKERAETVARQGSFTIAAPPITFNVTASFGGQTVDVERFSSYVEREIPLPDGLDPSKVTTAAVVDPDGSVRHVPTFITSREGKYYAVVNSLTNSDYTLIWNPKTFADVEGHWSKQAVSDMASRMIVSGVDAGRFDPDASITRAEFAAIVVRALGLAEDNGSGSVYSDVGAGEWYAGAVAQATTYGLIEGYADGTFGPARTISRQEALAVMVRAMKLAGLATGVNDADALLAKFADSASVASWAKPAVAAAVTNGLIEGRSRGLEPTSQLTRAETAAIVQRFLIRAKLIDNGGAAQD